MAFSLILLWYLLLIAPPAILVWNFGLINEGFIGLCRSHLTSSILKQAKRRTNDVVKAIQRGCVVARTSAVAKIPKQRSLKIEEVDTRWKIISASHSSSIFFFSDHLNIQEIQALVMSN